MGSKNKRNSYAQGLDKSDASSNASSNNNIDYSNGAFIDHRQHDLAHIHSSPARARRRSSQFARGSIDPFRGSPVNERVPLTDKNLRNFNSVDSVSPSDNVDFRSRVIDMDKYAKDQSQYISEGGIDYQQHPYYDDDNGLDNRSINSLEFGESNPSSGDSSDSTSLDDVCFPDYYDENQSSSPQWPDLNILREFINEELNEFKEDAASEHVNFKDQPRNVENDEMSSPSINSKHSLQVTPKPLLPWDPPLQLTQTVPILNKKNTEVCRFTYFRDDLANTIHSPSLSGLLANDGHTRVKEQPTDLNKKWRDQQEDPNDDDNSNLELEDLFQPITYTSTDSSTHEEGVTSQGVKINNAVQEIKTKSKSSLRVSTPIQNSPEVLSQTPGTLTDSISAAPAPPHVNPFWLDVLDPTEEEMKVLSKTFGIHPLTTEDIFLGEAREKVELFKSYYFICFTSFDIVYERRKQRIKEHEKQLNKLQELNEMNNDKGFLSRVFKSWTSKNASHDEEHQFMKSKSSSTSKKSKKKKVREGELSPLSMYMIVFKHGVITFHFSPTPHPINVRRRARLLKDYLTVSSDWISYALIDDITDSFAPMIDSIEIEVNSIEEAILRMHAGENDSDDSDEDSDSESEMSISKDKNVFVKRGRSKSVVDKNGYQFLSESKSKSKTRSKTSSSSSSSSESKILGWKRKGDMLRRIGECRKRVMSLLRLLGSKADVIKGFNKRLNETDVKSEGLQQSKLEISMYLGDIQDHIVTMVQSLNHYEKLLARFHSNYLAQINIDMTQVNNDTNDVLGKITILGTIVLPINVVTGLWGMNVLVPGQDHEGLIWFWSIVAGMALFSVFAYNYAKRAYGL